MSIHFFFFFFEYHLYIISPSLKKESMDKIQYMYNKAQKEEEKKKKNPWNDKSKTNNTAIKMAVNECKLVYDTINDHKLQ